MLERIRIRFNQFLEETREKSLLEALQKGLLHYLGRHRVVVPCYSDLSALKQNNADDASGLEFTIVDGSNVAAMAAKNRLASRRLKGIYNTRAGYYAYAVLRDGEIIGDIWCATPKCVKCDPIHPDLEWLGISCGGSDAYMFDMYVAPDARGKVITSFLLGNALQHLRESGYAKAYGFYEKSNIPALWTHKLFGYIELPKRSVSRFIFFIKSEPAG